MASPSSIPGLTDNEIDEEIMNEDLKRELTFIYIYILN